MANQATVIDIDTKFLENIKKSEQALINAANAADRMTQMFARATQGSGNMAAMFQSIQAGLDKVGAKADFSSGFLKANTTVRDTADMVNTLARNIDEAKSKYASMISSMNSSGGKIGGRTGITLLKEEDLNNISKLEKKVKEIDSFLSDGRRKTPSTETILKLTEFKEFYKAHIKELETTDEKRVEKKIKALRDEFKEMQRQVKALEKEQKAAQKAVDDAEEERYRNELIRLHRRQKSQEDAAKKNADAEIEMQKRIEKEVSDRQEREKTAESARNANAKAKASIDAYVSDRNKTTATADDYAQMFDKIEAKAKKTAEAIRKEYRNLNLEALASDPQKAIQFANKARTGTRLNVAKNILTEARSKSTDKKEIDQINQALQLVEDRLNKINGKELNIRVKDNIKIAKTSTDISELERAVESLNSDKLHFNVDTAAGQKKIAEITATVDQARAKIEELSYTSSDIEQLSNKEARAEYNKLKRGVKSPITAGDQSEVEAREAISARLLTLQDQINTSTARGYELYVKTGNQLRENEALMTKAALKSKDAKVSLEANSGALNIDNVESLVKLTNDAKTLRNAFEAIKRAKRDINPNTEEGREQLRRLDDALATTANRIKECATQQSRFMTYFNKLQGSGHGMSSTFSRIFATGAIMGFTNKVVKLHGEFEMLRKSLAVLVQSSEKANLVWGKITRLAVQSPFTVSDLATATRQMAAYRIEQDLIYEKTKMLADISAGLGVEMSRLILAYGQVKAANFLRGTELRQFSEAGIDMLGQLATYFTELEGRLVSAADVMERITKRQVMFEDVDEVLQRVTSRGGAFYKMQEEMATTVAGRLSNLKDEFMLSMDSIGKSHNETILKVIKLLKWMAQNLDVVIEKAAFMLKVWLAWKTTVIVNTTLTKGYATAVGLYTLATHKAAIGTDRLTAATNKFNLAAKGNAIVALASVAVGIAGAFGLIPNAIDEAASAVEESELNEGFTHMAAVVKEAATAFAAEQKEIGELSEKILNLTKNINKLNSADAEGAEASDQATLMMRERSILLSTLASKTSEYATELSAVIHDEEAMADIMDRNNKKLAAKTVLTDKLDAAVLEKATKELNKMYESQTTVQAYGGGYGNWDAEEVKKRYDPSGRIDKKWFESEDTLKKVGVILDQIYGIQEWYQTVDRWSFDPTLDFGSKRTFWYNLLKGDNISMPTPGTKDFERKFGEAQFQYLSKYIDLVAQISGDDEIVKLFNEYRESHKGLVNDEEWKQIADKFWGTEDLDDLKTYVKSLYPQQYESVTQLINDLVKAVNMGIADSATNLSSTDKEVQEKAQREVQAFLSEIFTQLEIDENAEVMLRKLIGEELDFSWYDFKTSLETWHKNFNNYTDEIRKSLEEQDIEIPYSIRMIDTGDISREDAKKAIEEDLKEVNEIIKVYEYNVSHGITDGAYTEDQYNTAKSQKPALEQSLMFLGGDDESGKTEKVAADVIRSIKDVHKAFKDLRKDFDAEISRVGAWEQYGDALNEALKPLGISINEFKSRFDLTTENGMIAAYEWLKSQQQAANELFEIERAIGDVTWEVNIENQNEAAERLNRDIENLFSGYELSVELEELHIPKDMAKKFFDIDITSINDLRKELFSRKNEFVGTDQEKEYQKFLDKLDEMETKSQQTRLKKYLDFSRDTIGERGKILFEGFNQLEDISKAFELTDTLALNENLISEKQFKAMREAGLTFSELMSKGDETLMSDAWGFTEEDIARIREYTELLEEQQRLAENAAVKNTNEELAKFDWEKFTGSEAYQELYNDMSNASASALTVLINKLEDHREQWSKLPIDQVEKYVDLLNEAKDALAATKYPSEQIDAAKEAMAKTGYSNVGDASSKMINAQLELDNLEKVKNNWDAISKLKEEGHWNDENAQKLGISKLSVEAETTAELDKQIDDKKDIISKSKTYLDAVRQIQDAYEKQQELLNKIKVAVDKIWEGWADINSIFEDDTMSAALQNLVKNVSDGVFGMMDMVYEAKKGIEAFATAEKGAEKMGKAIEAASGIIGAIVMGIKIVASILKFAFEQHDKMLQKQIDAQLEKVEVLKDRYEELEKQIEKAYTAVDYGRLTREANKNLEDQIAATEKMIALEEDKKKPDDSAIDGWKDEIKDMQNTIEDSFEEAFSTLSDGILDDVIGTTRSFVDAWHDACEETGDGMIGLEETFTDMLRNMLRQQASMQLISPFIKKYKVWLKDYINPEGGDDMLTVNEARMWAEKVRGTFPEVNELLENFFDGTQGLLETGGELSDLEKGIQGMTEDQAEVLAAYWNSCRLMISNIDVTLTQLAEHVMTGSGNDDSVLGELRTQTTILRDIRDYLSGVIGTGGNSFHTGSYVKISM